MSDHQRIDLDAALNESKRRPIDANWSPRKKAIVGGVAALVAAGAVSAGAWAYMNNRTPSLPRTMHQALAVMQSGKLDRMEPLRRAQYTEEARRILWSLTDEERRKLFEDEKHREALRAIREQTFDDMAYKRARGEEFDWSQFKSHTDKATENERLEEERERWANMTPEEREEEKARRTDEMRAEIADRVSEQFGSGNSQSGALRLEMKSGQGGGGKRGGGGR